MVKERIVNGRSFHHNRLNVPVRSRQHGRCRLRQEVPVAVVERIGDLYIRIVFNGIVAPGSIHEPVTYSIHSVRYTGLEEVTPYTGDPGVLNSQ